MKHTQLIRKAGFNKHSTQTGAVTLIQRFGSALNLIYTFTCCFSTAFIPNTLATLAGQALETILQHLAQQESPSLSRANVARGPPEQTVLFKRYITPFDLIANDLRKHGRTRCACWAILT